MIDPKDLEARLRSHREWVASTGAAGQRLELLDADLAGIDLERQNLCEVYLGGACLRGARLAGAQLYGAVLSGADLSGADL
ncbi:MAG TPA: pentapeptide repeat-containing protein, partial [Polyangiaceae bacterium]|nr:pentapeptide repeat-containing protein [Polyangiaceae bacterium]